MPEVFSSTYDVRKILAAASRLRDGKELELPGPAMVRHELMKRIKDTEISALLTKQTAAHEGTHQVLQNIGVQPRLSAWPLWLVEGLAEYCATPSCSRAGEPTWDGLGQINSLHMATLRELADPLSLSMKGPGERVKSLIRKPGEPIVESLLSSSPACT